MPDVEGVHGRRLEASATAGPVTAGRPGERLLRASSTATTRGGRERTPAERRRATRELRGDDGAERGDAEQPGDARDRVVHAGGDAGVRLVGVGEHRRGERRDRGDRPSEKRSSAGSRSVDVVDVGAAARSISAQAQRRHAAARRP